MDYIGLTAIECMKVRSFESVLEDATKRGERLFVSPMVYAELRPLLHRVQWNRMLPPVWTYSDTPKEYLYNEVRARLARYQEEVLDADPLD